MKKINPKLRQTVPYYFSILEMKLQQYEGESPFFHTQNAAFINFLRAKYMYLDKKQEALLIHSLKQNTIFQTHPFLSYLLKTFTNESFTSAQKKKLEALLVTYPLYPFTAFLKAVFTGSINGKADFITLLYALDHPKLFINNESHNNAARSLLDKGFPTALFALLKPIYEEEKSIELLQMIDNYTPDYITDKNYFKSSLLLRLFKESPKYTAFAVEILSICENLGAEEALLPLVEVYEKNTLLGEERFAYSFFYLTRAVGLNVPGAALLLAKYYEKGKYVPQNLTIAKILKDLNQ